MMDLSVQNCQAIVKSHYDALEVKDKKQRRKLAHALRVWELCQAISAKLAQEERSRLHPELLTAAALLHDIAKFDSDRLHHLQAIDIIRNGLGQESDEDEAALSALDQMILAHKDGFNPSPIYAADAAILRMADKIDQVRRKTRKSAKSRADVEEAKEKVARAEAKYKKAKKEGDLEKMHDKKRKLEEKEAKLKEKKDKLKEELQELQEAREHFQGSLEKITAYAQSESHGSCAPAFAQNLSGICESMQSCEDMPV